MALKLYRVDIDAVAYVVADSQDEAEQQIRAAMHYCDDELGAMIYASEYAGGLPSSDWVDSIPFGAANDRTVREWIDDPDRCSHD